MKSVKSLMSKILISVVLPVTLIFIVAVGIVMNIVSQNYDQFANIQNNLVLVFLVALIAMIGVILLATKNISNRMSQLAKAAGGLAEGDVEVGLDLETDKTINDQLGFMAAALSDLAKHIKNQADATQKMAEGDLSVIISPRSEKDVLGKHLLAMQKSVGVMMSNLQDIAEIGANGDLADQTFNNNLTGDYEKTAVQIKQTIKTIADKRDFFQAILDSMPYRITVVDNDMKWTFINKVLHDLRVSTGRKEEREELYGDDCCKSNLDMCKNEDCGVKAYRKSGRIEFPFEYRGGYYRMDTTPIIDKKGETIGYVETSFSTTSTTSVFKYSEIEILRLAKNLGRLAEGNLEFDMNIQEPNEYTTEVYQQFSAIETNLGNVKDSIDNLIEDAIILTTAAMQGDLNIRADETKFMGSWQELISGMNGILEVMIRPLEEVGNVMAAISNGNLEATINGYYQGSFDILKQAVNTMGSRFKSIVTEISTVTREIGNGNLAIDEINPYGGDFTAVSDALNTIVLTLNSLLSDINNASAQVNIGANQVSDSSQGLAQGSTEQASSIQELTASITEIADQTKNNAVNANKARELAADVMGNAEKGNVQMLEMQRSMVDINQSSVDISKIIKVIDDIAFQTNILALNAAVEAARAGQHGKGFAVVAEEVRTLAARSADAAKETTGLIEGSINKVQVGTRIADETADALNEIVDGITKVNDLIGNIAEASNEQASGIAQINMGVEQVAQVVQQNSATAEESAAASEELSGQSILLKQMIDQFQLR
ncbi:methyl-accepting chemotaxis protein [Acetobacterium woodii]|uniref:Putative methyl-accepting chemotaxis transducer protein n=1 Tax=Acetobacterium woodii (strain ATCC 29683 / DSM 1030 / JCM 2381 / KCTC 1655 / WB1) TaxID=931626 RepID=H6LHZ8_ACEWD|nr:methyl-accepting chemotaxis protein [Acetobacterium woodii]AFA48528.1 putative methyl-accepting chemotaxis transducer protein [Acetobacterium woodii DSM 1030]